jgi:undecaprenyl-diphosphatase
MDYRIFRAINQFAGRYRLLDMMVIIFSQKVRYLFLFILIFMWFRDNSHKKITLYAIISAGVSMVLNKIMKLFYFKPRPFLNLGTHLLSPFPSKKTSSFPSKHTALAFAAATSVMFSKRFLGSIMYLSSILTGLSRIWMGQHYPLDILASSLLGSITSVVVKMTGWLWNPIIDRIIQAYQDYCSRMKNHQGNSSIK